MGVTNRDVTVVPTVNQQNWNPGWLNAQLASERFGLEPETDRTDAATLAIQRITVFNV